MRSISAFIFFISCFCTNVLFAQTTINLQSADNGTKDYIARDAVNLNLGYEFSANASSNMSATINESMTPPTAYGNLFSSSNFDRSINTNLAVGAIGGEASVGENGAANYTIPIQLPKGTNGMEPSLALVYNSFAGNGILGRGWNLAGLSSITRVAKNIYLDNKTDGIKLDANDVFALDGNRLFANTGNYGADGTIYGTESETFSKITSKGNTGTGPSWFSVQTKNGLTIEFGNSSDSRLLAGTNTSIASWMINKIYDNYGNYMRFVYDNSGNDARIIKIEYTGNGSTSPYNTVDFIYSERNDKNTFYVAGHKINANHILDRIKISSLGEVVKKYEMVYGQKIDSYLSEVKEFGAFNDELNSTRFLYGDESDEITTGNVTPKGQSGQMATGDFNGDGLNDLVFFDGGQKIGVTTYKNDRYKVYLANNNEPSGFSYSTPSFEGNLPNSNIYNVGYNNVKSSTSQIADFDNDGNDDILIIEGAYGASTGSGNNTIPYIQYSNFRIMYSDGSSFQNVDFGPESNPFRSNPKINPINIYDYNGDGQLDIVTVLKRYTLEGQLGWYEVRVYSPDVNRIVTSQSYHLGASALEFLNDAVDFRVHDFNGDGVMEFLIVNENYSKIFKQDLSILYEGGFPTKWHKILSGDFNGDGNADLLTTAEADLTDWKLSYFNGQSFITTPFNFQRYNNDNNPDLTTFDFNNDGKTDILYRKNNSSTIKHDFYLSNGLNFIKKSFDYNLPTIGEGVLLTIGDFNGNGSFDIITTGNVEGYSKVIDFNLTPSKNNLYKITDGTNNTISFNYNTLPKINSSEYSKGSGLAFPLQNFEGTLPVVTAISTNNGIGGINTTQYQYYGGVLHKQGKGFLGFTQITSYNTNLNIITIKQYQLNNTYFSLIPSQSLTARLSPIETININTSNFEFINKGGKRYWLKVNSITNNDFITNQKSSSSYTYDNYGNLLTENSTIGSDQTISKTNQYEMFGSWIPSSLTKQTITSSIGNEPSYTRTLDYIYNADGSLISITKDPLKPKSVQTIYTYNNNGSVSSQTIRASNIEDQVTSYIYDTRGRNLLKIINPVGQTIESQYDERWCKPKWTKDASGLTSSYKYDNFGRLIQTTNAQGLKSNTQYQWDITSSLANDIKIPSNTLFKTISTADNSPEIVTWHDNLGREVKTSIEGRSQSSFTVNKYNKKGQLISTTEPFFADAETVLLSTTSYDDYGRANTTSTGAISTLYNYQKNGTTSYTVTTTAPNGAISSSKLNEAGRLVSATDQGGTLNYTYHSNGEVRKIVLGNPTSGQTLTEMEYDDYGNQIKLTDANAGITSYDYDALGRLVSQTDALGNISTLTYNSLNQNLLRIGAEGTTQYLYLQNGVAINQLQKVIGFNGIEEEYTYDTWGRVKEMKEKIDGVSYSTKYDYNKYNQITQLTYPSGFATKNIYDNKGFLTTVSTLTDEIIYELPEENASGQLTRYKMGNGHTTNMVYDQYSRLTDIQTTNIFEQKIEYSTVNYLISKTSDQIRQLYDEFTYDNLNRLTNVAPYDFSTGVKQNKAPINTSYTNTSLGISNGNIASKSDVGSYEYSNTKFNAVTKLSNVTTAVIPSILQEIHNTTFDRTADITEGNKQMNFTYGPSYDRKKMEYFVDGNLVKKRIYNGLYEKTIENGTTYEVHYIATGAGANAIYVKTNGVGALYYVYKDYLGSYRAITNSTGTIVAEQNYDAWGRERNPVDLSYTLTGTKPAWLYRGYTGHEMYPEFGIINMNNRMYDPLLGRMMAVDNFVQNPNSSQDYNRYTYAGNNPVHMTDPDGEHPLIVVAAAVLLLTTDVGYDVQKYISPVAVKVDLGFGSNARGIGIRTSVGIPQIAPVSLRIHGGIGYWWGNGQVTPGWQSTYGGEIGITPFFVVGTTWYNSPGKQMDQRNFHFRIGTPFINFKYENDFAFGLPLADGGDRYRTAAQRLTIGPISFTNRMFTGDPGFDPKKRDHYDGGNGYSYYRENKQYREGIGTISLLGIVHLGTDSERRRHDIQNKLIHDHLPSKLGTVNGKTARFEIVDRPKTFYWQIGATGGGYLY